MAQKHRGISKTQKVGDVETLGWLASLLSVKEIGFHGNSPYVYVRRAEDITIHSGRTDPWGADDQRGPRGKMRKPLRV